ncbi:protein eiger isoform X2 [Drosophila busckii]|uniref:protein eiger isoform X2 n=1 Tax=Drosophila busckii TaxID=30019 RepID=UPI00083E96E8|nr:protein eiger isoform X2 [Drosophila busckii]
MTAETLKPFITPTSAVNNFPAKQPASVTHSQRRSKQLIPIVLSSIGVLLVIGIFSLTIWQTTRVKQLENNLNSLQREVNSLRQRLGINYLEDLAEFQKEYANLLIHDPSKLDDIESEDDDLEYEAGMDDVDDEDDEDGGNENTDYDEYLDLVKQEKASTQQTTLQTSTDENEAVGSTSSASNDDNVFDDFTSYNESKRKRKERKSRSIAELSHELHNNKLTELKLNKTEQTAETAAAQTHAKKSRQRSRQSRNQRLLIRKTKSIDSNAMTTSSPAAHFHLNRKLSHHEAPIKMHSYQGDMYIGQATASSENQWEQHFSVNNGVLTVLQPGLYYIYAQICYNNTHDQNGFIIFHGQNAFLQCLNTVPTNMPQKVHTCHTSGLIQLQQNESIHLRDIHRDRNVMLREDNNRSYFGIIKV